MSNIQDKNYWEIYPETEDVFFDISAKQLKNKKNQDWSTIKEGSLVCVIMSSRKVSTFFKVSAIIEIDNSDQTEESRYVLTGQVVAKSDDREDVTRLLNKFQVQHTSLPKNKIGVGFKIADIKDGWDELLVKVADGSEKTLGEVKVDSAI
ncbi:MAG: hypothetical protein KTR16_17230 [Acidiferrobacterales bacterium]|nr:hypothetical protein [Acidiferrobacterales bacterium]